MDAEKIIERLEQMSIPEPNSGCWLWLGMVSAPLPYGRISISKGRRMPGVPRMFTAHRVSYEAHIGGEVPDELVVCHRCDNPSCINPDHLFLGTQLDNITDMHNKGRAPNIVGEKNVNAKITEPVAAEVKRLRSEEGLTAKEVAARLGIPHTIARNIYCGASWGHVPPAESVTK